MTRISAEEIEQNWLWIGVDCEGCLASFQSFGIAELPPSVLESIENAEIVQEYVANRLFGSPGYCEARFMEENYPSTWRAEVGMDKYEENWNKYVDAAVRAASCGVCIYDGTGGGYVQVAAPLNSRLITSLPDEIRRIVELNLFQQTSFGSLPFAGREDIAKVIGLM